MAKFNQTYPTDLKYTEWQQIMEFFPSSCNGPSAEMGKVAGDQCDSVRQPYRMSMADVADQFSSLANGALLLLALATGRLVAADQ